MRPIQDVLKEFCEYALANDHLANDHDVHVVFCSPKLHQYGVKIAVQEWDESIGSYANLFEYYEACVSYALAEAAVDECLKIRRELMNY